MPSPWALRLVHEGYASLRLERPGRTLRFDPVGAERAWAPLGEPPAATGLHDDDVVVLTWNEPDRIGATARAVEAGGRPAVIALPAVLAWLQRRGPIDGREPPLEIDGISVRFHPYTPIPYAEGMEIVRKVWSTALDPLRAFRRLRARSDLPDAPPAVVELGFPSGFRLVHLNLALHDHTPEDWMARAAQALGGADLVIAGVDYGYEEAFLRLIPRLRPRRLVLADLLSDVRRAIGLPTGLLTPLADRLDAAGVETHVLATRSSFRLESLPSPAGSG